MKNIIILLTAVLFTFTGLAQEKINWLTTSEFEKAVKKENKNSFILIENDIVNENITKERVEEMNKRFFSFLEDEMLIEYLNENFICYKFNISSEDLNFQGKKYLKTEERGKSSHEFSAFLTESKRNIRFAQIVLRDQEFNLFEYQVASPKIEEMKVLLEAEKLKINYLKEQLGADSRYLKESESSLKRQEKRLKLAQENKKNKSVFPAKQKTERFLKTLTYFVSKSYQKTDLESFKKQNNKN
ncbi:MAG: hypothetical protein P8L43_04635 [Candidatus Marinimicrobia bacterium]|nr:hypothetical protein [Candidatus Neomarinimicrobiota bacterium]